jgi:hypothetical protein
MRVFAIFCAVVSLLAAFTALGFALVAQNSVTALRHENAKLTQQIGGMSGQIAGLRNEMATLTVPTDPLSAYNEVCSANLTNDETGITSTYWYPCTDQAQTIPQPGT